MTIVSLCTSIPTNRVGFCMTRLLCLRLHARPSGATLDHRHIAMTGHPFRPDTDMRSSAGSTRAPSPRVMASCYLGMVKISVTLWPMRSGPADVPEHELPGDDPGDIVPTGG